MRSSRSSWLREAHYRAQSTAPSPNNGWVSTTAAPTDPTSSYVGPEKGRTQPMSSRSPGQERDQNSASVSKETTSSPPPPTPASTPTVAALDWDGPDDPLNPHNWSEVRKWYQTYTTSGLALVGTFASSAFTPGMDLAAEEFGSPLLVGTLAFSIYQLGLAAGGPFAAPMSETFGRRPVYFISMPLFGLFILGTGFAPNMAALVVLRFFAGLFAAPSLSMGSGTLADIWPPEKRAAPMSLYVATPFLGPALGPLLGAAVTRDLGWRWTSWLILFFTIVLVVLPVPFYIESYKPVLLRRRAKKRGLPVPKSPLESLPWHKVISTYATTTLNRPLHMLFTEPIVTAFNAYSAFNFALLYAFFAAFPWVFQEEYGFDSLSTGLTFLGLGAGVIIGTIGIYFFSTYYYRPKVRHSIANDEPAPKAATSRVAPEARLPLAFVGGPCITIGLFLFGWSAAYRVHWIVPTIAEAFFGLGNLSVFMGCTMYITDTYGPLYGASAMASNAILRYVLGATFPLFAVQMFRNLGTQWACTLLGCLSVLGACVPWVLMRFGKGLRERSGYKRGD
ncbi:benomyl/methotrexate resistance protein [Pleomassaria siparia CBS 279.74]|uniref:Benomyl/methotrexate resistance protein n=1 Tax=Pleomassaria siparia CBS 279.74 TaxID=1314801 RepID=A0A6G1JZV4_9PLEO|nr:benomyl/methotrexate resistance protein [Pleomassaria siparia CBS 279.74]